MKIKVGEIVKMYGWTGMQGNEPDRNHDYFLHGRKVKVLEVQPDCLKVRHLYGLLEGYWSLVHSKQCRKIKRVKKDV